MTTPHYAALGDEIYCIDALYVAPEIACCYLIGSAGEYALVETGTARSLPNVLATLDAVGVSREQLRYVIPTHVHLDHAGGVGQLMALFPDATLLIHPRGARHMINPERLVASSITVYGEQLFDELYGEILPVPEGRVRELADGERITLGKRQLLVRHTRGHAEHHFCLFDDLSRGWFSGDMFGISYPILRFANDAFVMPATTPTQFDPALYAASVRLLANAQPKQCFLTHFSALPFAPQQAALLIRQLNAYAELGDSTLEGDDLRAAVVAIAENELRPLAGDAEAARIAASMGMDATLNAQGIAWWREHRAHS